MVRPAALGGKSAERADPIPGERVDGHHGKPRLVEEEQVRSRAW